MFKPMRSWRVITWVWILFNAVMLGWLMRTLSSANQLCSGLTESHLQACETGKAMSLILGVGMMVFFLVAGNVTIAVISVTTRGSGSWSCPRCWANVRDAMPVCPRCSTRRTMPVRAMARTG